MNEAINPLKKLGENFKEVRVAVNKNEKKTKSFVFGGVGWDILFSTGRTKRGFQIRVILKCRNYPEDDNSWFLLVSLEFYPHYEHVHPPMSKSCRRFSKNSSRFHFFNIYWYDTPRDKIDDPIMVTLNLEIEDSKNLNPRPIFDAFERFPDFADIAFIVDGKRILANRMLMSIVSKKFKKMFKNEEEKSEFELENIDLNNFLELLNVVGAARKEVSNVNVVKILPLSRKFEIEPVVKQCESCLIEDDTRRLMEKLKLAHEFRLDHLKKHVIDRFKFSNRHKRKGMENVWIDTIDENIFQKIVGEKFTRF